MGRTGGIAWEGPSENKALEQSLVTRLFGGRGLVVGRIIKAGFERRKGL